MFSIHFTSNNFNCTESKCWKGCAWWNDYAISIYYYLLFVNGGGALFTYASKWKLSFCVLCDAFSIFFFNFFYRIQTFIIKMFVMHLELMMDVSLDGEKSDPEILSSNIHGSWLSEDESRSNFCYFKMNIFMRKFKAIEIVLIRKSLKKLSAFNEKKNRFIWLEKDLDPS